MKAKSNSVAIGNFDGLHAGHQALLQYLLSRRRNCHPRVLTFDPHPKAYFEPRFPLINTASQREELIRKYGVQEVVFVDFSRVLNLNPEDFVRQLLVGELACGEVVVGHDFRFGKKRTGNIGHLTTLSGTYGFQLTVIPPVTIDHRRVSSTFLREWLLAGRVDDPTVLNMMTRRYFIDGQVVRGKGVGRSLGFPTLNMQTENRILPEGVFETRLEYRGKKYRSITNVGFNPTFRRTRRSIETYILNFSDDLYRQRVRLHFVRKIREERRFRSHQALVEQIRRDLSRLK